MNSTQRSKVARIAAARQEGTTVVLKFTATWCTKCKVLEHRVYRKPSIVEAEPSSLLR